MESKRKASGLDTNERTSKRMRSVSFKKKSLCCNEGRNEAHLLLRMRCDAMRKVALKLPPDDNRVVNLERRANIELLLRAIQAPRTRNTRVSPPHQLVRRCAILP